MYYSIYRST